MLIFLGAGIALDWNAELNAARTSIQRVVLFVTAEITIPVCERSRNGAKLPFSPVSTVFTYTDQSVPASGRNMPIKRSQKP